MSLLELFCTVDEFCVRIEQQVSVKQIGKGKPGPQAGLCWSEVMTILIHFHQSHYRDFKAYYIEHVCQHLRSEFPGLVSYNRFVELIPVVLPYLLLFLRSRLGKTRGIAFMDSTTLPVCHNKRIFGHKVFEGLAARGKSTLGYFFGFKLHLVVNDQGELLSFMLSPGNVNDRKPVLKLVKKLWGKLFADKGYVSQKLFEQLFAQGIQLVTPQKKSKKKQETRMLPLWDKLLVRKRSIIETINDQLKNISQIAHTRHRSPTNFLVNLLSGLLAYTFQDKKPAIRFDSHDLALLPAII
ncbi:MAG: IS982 family transposase [Caldilineaceae bacterium]